VTSRTLVVVILGAIGFVGSASAIPDMTIVGTTRADVLRGTERADVIRGLAGNDTLRGRGGSDRLDGGPGSDVTFGDAGNDSLVAGGVGFADELHGGAGDDSLTSKGGGIVRLIGGQGNDVLRGSSTPEFTQDTFSGGPGNDRLLGYDFESTADAFMPNGCGAGVDVVEVLGAPVSARTEIAETLRSIHGCER
jgi:Ca2+-binding RTX toxin-like protein